MQKNTIPQPTKRTALIIAIIVLFIILASWFICLFMGDDAAVRMSMTRIIFIFMGIICTFLFSVFIMIGLKIWRRQRLHN